MKALKVVFVLSCALAVALGSVSCKNAANSDSSSGSGSSGETKAIVGTWVGDNLTLKITTTKITVTGSSGTHTYDASFGKDAASGIEFLKYNDGSSDYTKFYVIDGNTTKFASELSNNQLKNPTTLTRQA